MELTRRSFMALASGLLVPYEPERIYSFMPAWRLLNRKVFERDVATRIIKVMSAQEPDRFWIGAIGSYSPPPRAGLPGADFTARHRFGVIHPSNEIDVRKSSEAFGIPVVFA